VILSAAHGLLCGGRLEACTKRLISEKPITSLLLPVEAFQFSLYIKIISKKSEKVNIFFYFNEKIPNNDIMTKNFCSYLCISDNVYQNIYFYYLNNLTKASIKCKITLWY